MSSMEALTVSRQPDTEEQGSTANTGERYALKVVLVYHDELTRRWAGEVDTRVRQLVGEDSLQATWWNIREMNQPEVLAAATDTALESDVIVVAIRAGVELPLAFYYWTDAWLPRRASASGALVALVGLPEHSRQAADEIRAYLRALCRRGQLDFIMEERRLPETSKGLSLEPAHASQPARMFAPSRAAFAVPFRNMSPTRLYE